MNKKLASIKPSRVKRHQIIMPLDLGEGHDDQAGTNNRSKFN